MGKIYRREIGAVALTALQDSWSRWVPGNILRDEVLFMAQMGNIAHEDVCESLRMFADEVMPEFKEGEEERERAKLEELAPYLEAAMERKRLMPALSDDEIPEYPALGRQVYERGEEPDTERGRQMRARMEAMQKALASD